MPTVAVSQKLIDDHVNWHTKKHEQGGRKIPQGQIGSGEEFLNWHKGFISRYRRWCKQNSKPVIEPWSKIPSELKPVPSNINRLNLQAFDTLDDFGIFLESGVHILLHDRAAGVYNEPILRSFESPRSSYFWKLHGLIDQWRKNWINTHRP